MFGSFGAMEVVVVVFLILLLFGAKKIPELARGLGQGINEFKKASSNIRKEIEEGGKESESSQTTDTKKNETAE